jgi:glycine/D-amino acid oxidase-like deaminating enzyme
LGGTHQVNDFSRKVNDADLEFIMVGCSNMVSSMKNARVERHWVGLRPGRDSVRLELVEHKTEGRNVPIIHNYGHGGSGVTLAWGCATDVLELAKQYFSSKKLDSKL